MVFSIFIPGNLISLANLLANVPNDTQVSLYKDALGNIQTAPSSGSLETLVSTIPNGSDVYFYKDATGNLKANNTEHPLNISNFGYPFQFIDGSVSYTTVPISYLNQIPWQYTYSTLYDSSYTLWDYSLMIWIDAMEPKAISNSLQKVVSKDFSNNLIVVENTTNYSFQYTSPNLSLTNNSSLESSSVLIVEPYFKLGMVFTLLTQTLNTVLFQHNRLKIKITSQTATDESTQTMIGIFDNDVFKRGIKLNSDLSFKYFLYTDHTGTLNVSSNTSYMSATPSYYQATSSKIYIGSDSTKTYPSNMTLHELLFYESDYNVPATSAEISNYFTVRHGLSTYNDLTNIISPFWTSSYSRGDRRSVITISSNFSVFGANGGSLQNWVDGSVASAQSWYFIGGQAVAGKYINFTFATSQIITGFKIISSNADSAKVFDFQGSTNNSSWISLGNFIYLDPTSSIMVGSGEIIPDTDFVNDFGNPVPVDTHLFNNNTAYQYYRMMGISGTTTGSPYEYEILFKIATIPYSWTNTYSKGDRTSIITITSGMDYSAAGSAPSCIVNGIFSGGGVTTADRLNYSPTNSAPYFIRFQLAVAQKIMAFKIAMIVPDTVPLLSDWQGSTDGITWITLSPASFDIFTNKTVILGDAIIPDTGSQIMSVGNGQVYTHTFNPPSIPYLYYRILFNTNPASTLGAGYITEINFKTSA